MAANITINVTTAEQGVAAIKDQVDADLVAFNETVETKTAEFDEVHDDAIAALTGAQAAAAQADAAALTASTAASSIRDGVQLGAWNPSTNTPALTADASAVVAGGYYDVTVAGNAPFAGSNFASGSALAVGDKIKKAGSQWYRVPFTISNSTITQRNLARGYVRVLASRTIRVNLQAKTITITASTPWSIDTTIVSIATSVSLDITSLLAGGSAFAFYYDLADSSYKVGAVSTLPASAQCIVVYYSLGLYGHNVGACVLIGTDGVEIPAVTLGNKSISTALIADYAVGFRQRAWGEMTILSQKTIRVNLQTKTLTITATTPWVLDNLIGSYTTSVSLDLTSVLTGPAWGFYHNLNGSAPAVSLVSTMPASAQVIFLAYNGIIYGSNRQAVQVIGTDGIEVPDVALANNSITKNLIFQGSETAERLLLTDEVYAMTDRPPMMIYKNSLLGSRDYSDQVRVAAYVPNAPNRRYFRAFYDALELDTATFDPATNSTFVLSMTQNWSKDYVFWKTLVLKKKASTSVAGKTITMLCQGDSLTEQGWTQYAAQKLNAFGATAKTIGTKGNSTIRNSEGRSGWSFHNFIGRSTLLGSTPMTLAAINATTTTNYENPFLKLADATDKANYPNFCFRFTGAATELSYAEDPDKTGNFYIYDLSWYLANHCNGEIPNVGTIALGTNNLLANPTNATWTDLASILDFMIRRFYEAAPNAYLGIMPSPPSANTEQGSSHWKSNYSPWIERCITQVNALKGTFPKLYTVPAWLHINPEFSFRNFYTTVDLSPYSTIKKSKLDDWSHFNDFGQQEYAEAMTAWIVNII